MGDGDVLVLDVNIIDEAQIKNINGCYLWIIDGLELFYYFILHYPQVLNKIHNNIITIINIVTFSNRIIIIHCLLKFYLQNHPLSLRHHSPRALDRE